MSKDPFDFSKEGFGNTGFGVADAVPPGLLAVSQQPQPPSPSGGWVSFDDDSGFTTAPGAPAPTAVPQAPPPGGQFAATGTSWTSPWSPTAPGPAWTAPQGVTSSVATAPPAQANPFAVLGVTGPAAAPTSTIGPALTSVSAPVAVTVAATVAALHNAQRPSLAVNGTSGSSTPGPGPGSVTPQPALPVAPLAGGSSSNSTTSTAADPPNLAPLLSTGPLPASVHRLPRPPTSAARPAPAATTSNPFTAAGPTPAQAVAPPLTSSNPFASTAKAHGATAAARSLDPFADLSLKPQLSRPPPMSASKAPAPASTALAAAAPAPSAGVGTAPGPQPPVAPELRSSAPQLGVSSRESGAAQVQAAAPPSAAPPSVFPTFVALHQQAGAALGTGPGAMSAGGSAKALSAGPSPSTAAASPTSPPLHVVSSPQRASFEAAAAGTQGPPGRHSAAGTASFDAFVLSRIPSHVGPQSQPVPSSPLPPPPPYSVAVELPSAQSPSPPRNGAPAAEEGGAAAAVTPLPPPPAYLDALNMPPAQPRVIQASPPPPSYEDAVALPVSESHAEASSQGPQPVRGPTGSDGSWAAFGDKTAACAIPNGAAVLPPPPALTPAAAAAPVAGPSPTLARRASPLVPAPAVSPPLPVPPSAQPPSQPAPLPDQICVEVRLPPFKPKEAACPRRLVAGMGLAFAAPGTEGVAALQWSLNPGQGPAAGEAGGPHFMLPPGAVVPRTCEDWDSAPAAALSPPATVSDLPTTCSMLLDDVSGSLWTGHKDGRVVRWSVARGRPAVYEHHWRAHLRGKIASMTLTPWGELWTASSAGSVRAWQYSPTGPASRTPTRIFECRRARLTLGPAARASAQRAHSKVRLLALGPSGRVVWSAGRTGMVLWGAYDGEYLGTLTPGLAPGDGGRLPGGPGTGMGMGAFAGDTGAMALAQGLGYQQLEINPQTGLDSGLINRPFVPRWLLDLGDEAADAGDSDLGAQMINRLAGAAKLAAKLGKKTWQKFASDPVSGASDGYGPADTGSGGAGGVGLGGRGKVVALVPGLHQAMYVVYQRGVVEKYTEWGRLLWTRDYGRSITTTLHSAALVGCLLWLGCGDGVIRTAVAATGDLGRSWKAHDFPVAALAHDAGGTCRGSGLVYSLSENGSVRAWPGMLPAESQLLAWRDGLLPSLRRHQLAVLAATWNVNETRPSSQSLRKWLAPAATTEIVSIALQEVEMGTSSVARDAAITLLSKGMLERGNQNAQWWASELGAALACTGHAWVRVALRQMSGLVVVVFCRAELQQFVGEVATANVACGIMGVGGNKGAVAVSMSVFRRRVMFVSSHFAAHQERVDERNDNYTKIVRLLHFDNTSKAAAQQRQQQQQQQQSLSDPSTAVAAADGFDGDAAADPDSSALHRAGSASTIPVEVEDDGHGPGMSDAAMLVWAGDFNYRIRGSYAEVSELACIGRYEQLFQLDQCRQEMDKGNIFRGLREPLPLGHPVFVPTYKYDKGEPHSVEPGGRLRLPFDSSEKQRVPAWTDRVFYRGSRPGSLDVAAEEVQVSVAQPSDYNCVLDVTDSDHKPVYALLQVQLPAYKQDQKRRHSLASAMAVHSAALASSAASTGTKQTPLPTHPLRVSTTGVDLRPNGATTFELQHTCTAGSYRVQILAERAADGTLCPLPPWLEVSPHTFTLTPAEAPGWDGADAAVGRVRVLLRALPVDGSRVTESMQLRLALQPLWGTSTRAGGPGPAVVVHLRP